jgi:hypothetical protein
MRTEFGIVETVPSGENSGASPYPLPEYRARTVIISDQYKTSLSKRPFPAYSWEKVAQPDEGL